jgi:hypothetical protein
MSDRMVSGEFGRAPGQGARRSSFLRPLVRSS